MDRAEHVAGLQFSLRAALAAGLSVGLSNVLNLQSPLVALISACLVTDLDPHETPRLGLPRMAGTVLGAVLGAVLTPYLGSGGIGVGVGVFAAMFVCHVVRLVSAGARVGGYVCGIVILSHTHDSWTYAAHRIADTVIGIGMAILVSFVPKRFAGRRPVSQDM